jgi:hypothetical protein
MKTILFFVIAVLLVSCAPGKEVQIHTVAVQLVKIDTIYRFPNKELLLTWLSEEGTHYISFEEYNNPYVVGTKFLVMVKR